MSNLADTFERTCSLNGNGSAFWADALMPTDEDISSQFPALVEATLLGDAATDTRRYWITVHDQSYRWVGTHYERIRSTDLQREIVKIARTTTSVKKVDGEEVTYHPFTKPRCIEEGLKWFRQITAVDPDQLNPPGLINCRNGVVRIVWAGADPSAVLEPHNPERHFFIDAPGLIYDPTASQEHVKNLLSCLEAGGRKLFLEVLGATLDIDTIRALGHRIPAMLLIGQGENGKDTLREAVSRIHGRSSVATLGISDWQQYEAGSGRGRFSIAPLDRARLSIASENSGAFKLDNLETLKAAITGDPVYVERKGVGGNTITPKAAFLFFLNSAPLLDGGSHAILSRWGVAQMPHSYSTNPKSGQKQAEPRFKHDPEFMATEVLPALLNLMIDGLASVAAQGFSLDGCADAMQELRENTSHLHQFLRDAGYVVGGPADCVDLKALYDDLDQWYRHEGWKEMDRAGDWKFIETGDGDKPVKASRLLPKRLISLHPSLRREQETGKSRNVLIYGLHKDGAKTEGKTEPNTEETIQW